MIDADAFNRLTGMLGRPNTEPARSASDLAHAAGHLLPDDQVETTICEGSFQLARLTPTGKRNRT